MYLYNYFRYPIVKLTSTSNRVGFLNLYPSRVYGLLSYFYSHALQLSYGTMGDYQVAMVLHGVQRRHVGGFQMCLYNDHVIRVSWFARALPAFFSFLVEDASRRVSLQSASCRVVPVFFSLPIGRVLRYSVVRGATSNVVGLFPRGRNGAIFPFLAISIISLVRAYGQYRQSLNRTRGRSGNVLLQYFARRVSPLYSARATRVANTIRCKGGLLRVFIKGLLASYGVFWASQHSYIIRYRVRRRSRNVSTFY